MNTQNKNSKLTINYLKERGVIIDHFQYRGEEVDLYEELEGRQLVALLDDQLIELGKDNTCYQDDLKMIIDEKLDTITRFSDNSKLYGSKLEYFQNGSFRDIRLVHRGRVLKIYLLSGRINENDLISDAVNTLIQYLVIKDKD